MASAVRMHATERGGTFDRLTMVAFGAPGPSMSYHLADKLGIAASWCR